MVCKLALYSVIVMYIMIPTTSADYTEELQNVFIDDVIFDCGNWSAVQNPTCETVDSKYYNWRESESARWNRARMNNPTRFDMPENTTLHSGPAMLWVPRGGLSPCTVAWIAVHSVMYSFTVEYKGYTYTNDTFNMSYKAAWLPTPCFHFSDMNRHIDEVAVSHSGDGITFAITGHVTDSDGDQWPTAGSKTIPFGTDDVRMWQSVNPSINVSISNFTDRCTVLSVETPAGITGIRIDAQSKNMTAFYEKHGYYMELNETEYGHQFFDLKEHVFENHSNMSPIGVNLYSLPKDDYNISVTLYTPFEVAGANISIVETDPYATDAPESPIKQVLCLLVVLSGFVFLGRSI